jgi:hypothetical protein
VEKDLLSAGPNKILSAIDALDSAIGILAFSTRWRFAGEFHL